MLILAVAIIVIGVSGGVVEHFRLTASTEQRGEQDSRQAGVAEEEEEGDRSGNSQQSRGAERASAPRQQSSSNGNSQNSGQSGSSVKK
jgi:basic membrane lipoprotein Med (substrate-binding protein (PBP1-ABC) superfamily)